MRSVTVLYACKGSVYNTIPGLDVWDAQRDAMTYRGNNAIIAHPPCRMWGILAHFAKPRPGEEKLAMSAVLQVRLNGGVLEHPAASRLWPTCGLPEPGTRDAYGGFTIVVPQFWWGHEADKATRLYICGIEPKDLPEIPLVLGIAPRTMRSGTKADIAAGLDRPELLKSQREKTPVAFANWLIDLAQRTRPL